MTTKIKIVTLYKSLLKEAKLFKSYNFREYSVAKIRYQFKLNKSESDSKKIDYLYQTGINDLNILHRQVIINKMFATDPLIIEKT